jgi:hypothetical protein
MKFNVYYAITDDGECEETGAVVIAECLRDAIKDLFRTRTNEVGGIHGIEANCDPLPVSGWLEFSPSCTVYNGMEYRTGQYENRSLHPCGRITASSWRRIVRLIKP